MSKEVIIDNVNVSECKYLRVVYKELLADNKIMEFKNYCCVSNTGCYAINCNFKQLKRCEQKLEKIRNLVSRYRSCYAEPILEIIEGAEDD